MRLTFFSSTIFTLLTLTSSHVIKRDVRTVLSDFSTLTAHLDTFSAAVYSYSGGMPAALEIQNQETAIERAIDQTAMDTNATAPFSAVDSTTVTETLTTLEPVMRSSIAALVNKRQQFMAAGVGQAMQNNLRSLKMKTDGLSAALQSKASGSDKETIRLGTGDVDDAFDSAIDAYDTPAK
ncbi:hypothetical protein BO70DRAFT_416999 [Aspergillus heteromorphus CBS 117.55]|uniref:Hydrophobic surface binding protein A n=1 Tax=Aspergillus heteromorphus CBS 117.55 TaxID=1448321 RepID=A0A317V4S5_9EURO|nr:uncharacterized protein BO70DRAFT_416999 [Aspergillus heteromorphus CBS 117.55]PWY69105.1 hypothetical protein BO70DRAFT_416999 [Aspergillus heteromorphus CBS 117.55]